MNRNPMRTPGLLGALVILAFGLAGGGVADAQEPPPAFEPVAVEVKLGDNGGTVTLMTTADGGFTLNEEPFAGGAEAPVEGEGGRWYVLTLGEDETWTAAFVPVEVMIDLGASGTSVTLATTEVGGWTLDGEAFAGGAEAPVEGEGGRWYVLTLGEDGTWTAAFVPVEVMVDLGASGASVTLATTEVGGWTLDGEAFAGGAEAPVEGEGGRWYVLTLGEDGTWTAAFVPVEVMVDLGASGASVTLATTEAGGWTRDGEAFSSGTTVQGGTNVATGLANEYELTFGEDGTWTAAFVPVEVMIDLGASGASVTLATTEAGGWTRDGEAFSSGTTVQGGTSVATGLANEYELTLGEDGTWTAAFVPMELMIDLGASGASVTLATTEAGGWTRDGEAFSSGTTVQGGTNVATGAANEYELTLGEDGTWTAAFVPVEVMVDLGASGASVTLATTEAGGWTRDGEAFSSGTTVQGGTNVATGLANEYELTFGEDGTWTAAFVPMALMIDLGTSGASVTLATTEAGGWTRDGEAFSSGTTVQGGTSAATGGANEYELTFGEDGTWTAAFVPVEVMIDLGISGTSVTLVTTEAGGWTRDGEAFSSGTTVQGGNNAATGAANEYELTLADGEWTPTYRPARMTISGTGGLEAVAREDGTGYAVGEDSLPASGDGEITDPDDAMYRVVKDAEGMLAGTRFDLPMVGRTMQINVTGTGNPAPRLNADDPDTDANEAGTMLEALKEKFPMDELLGGGESTVNAATIVSTARGEIAKIRDRVAQLVALYRDEGITRTVLNNQVSEQWAAADVQLRNIFGGTEETRTLERESSPDRVVAAFDRVVEALSSEEAFAAATLAGGPDALQGFLERNATQAAAAFNRPKSTSTARLGVLHSTRFGVATFNDTAAAQTGFGSAESVQAFAWSTMEATRRASDVRASGYGHYTGQTLAADQAGNHYSGTIDIEVRFARMAVDGLVTGLVRADTQEPWSHGLGGVVTRIALPTATLGRTGSWMVTNRSATNRGRMSFVNRAGSWPDEALGVGSSFSGRLLGTGDAAGSEAIGTWEAAAGNTTLAGAFGATRGADREPPGAALTSNTTAIGQTGDARATIEVGPAMLAAIEDVDSTMNVDESRPAIAASTVINTGNTKFKYNPPPMDTAAADEYVNGNYEPQRAAVLAAGDWKLEKGNWVADAHAEITKKLGQLRRSIALDGADASDDDRTFANQQRQKLFDDIQAEIEKVFGPSQGNRGENEEFYTGVLTRASTSLTDNPRWTAGDSAFHGDYPVNSSGVAQDAGVLAEIEDVLAALADADAFAAQFETDGLFADLNVDAQGENMRVADYPSPAAIFGRPRGELRVVAAATDFTRLGAWRHRVSANAVSGLADQSTARGARGEEFGAFAYSPLDPTAAYASATSRLYPARGAAGPVTASYAGQTVASETVAAADGGSKFYEGAVEATVFWDPATVTDSKVSVTVSELTDRDSGEPMTLGGSFEVGSLKWTADVANDGGLVKFTSAEARASAAGLGGGELAPKYNNQLRFEHVSNWQQADDYNFGPNNNDYRRLKGTHAEDWGSLSFTDVRSGGSTNNPNAAQRAQLATDQENLQMPVWAVKGPRVNTTQSTNNDKPTFIFVFRDGSMLQFADQHGTTWLSGYNSILNPRWVPAIGIDNAKNPDNIYATRVPGSPALSANNGEHLFTRAGGPFVGGWPTTGDGGAGTGQPNMSPSELFLSYVSDRGYDFETSAELEGMFVGQDADGPLGMIGTWSMGPIRGAFGADLQP